MHLERAKENIERIKTFGSVGYVAEKATSAETADQPKQLSYENKV